MVVDDVQGDPLPATDLSTDRDRVVSGQPGVGRVPTRTERLPAKARVPLLQLPGTGRDHLTFLDRVMPEAHIKMGLREQAASLPVVQARFATDQSIRVFGEVERGGTPAGSQGIRHNLVIEELALPGQLVIGSDSHTCMAGALGCLAFGVGSTDLANAWMTRDVRVRVPETVRFRLHGRLGPWVTAKDVMLFLLAQPYWRSGRGIGKVLEFCGDGVAELALDERATLTNMAVEAGGFTGIASADERVVQYLVEQRGLDAAKVRASIVQSDPEASYAETFDVDLATIEPMVALPGDPRNGVALREFVSTRARVKIDIAYGGSCTGGKKSDMDMYAAVLGGAVARGERVAPGVRLYLQFGSQDDSPLRRGSGLPRTLPARGGGAHRAIVRRVHSRRPRACRLPRAR